MRDLIVELKKRSPINHIYLTPAGVHSVAFVIAAEDGFALGYKALDTSMASATDRRHHIADPALVARPRSGPDLRQPPTRAGESHAGCGADSADRESRVLNADEWQQIYTPCHASRVS